LSILQANGSYAHARDFFYRNDAFVGDYSNGTCLLVLSFVLLRLVHFSSHGNLSFTECYGNHFLLPYQHVILWLPAG